VTKRGRLSVRRSPPRLEQRKRILAVCEGKVTEPEYFYGLCKHLRNNLLELETIGAIGVPLSVVDEAIERKKRSDQIRRRRRDDAFDEVWAVFDRDDHPGYTEAQHKARDNGVLCATSDPSFELWLLLHFQDQTAPIDRDKARRKLKKHLPQYDKHVDFDPLTPGLDEACARAEHLRTRAQVNKTDGNPSTQVDLLVASARADTQPQR
jgi:hypothetical protein